MRILGFPELPLLNRLFIAIALFIMIGTTGMAQSEPETVRSLRMFWWKGLRAVHRRSAARFARQKFCGYW